MKNTAELEPGSYWIRKFVKISLDELRKHSGHTLRVDSGVDKFTGGKTETQQTGLWCDDCQDGVGLPAEYSRRVGL